MLKEFEIEKEVLSIVQDIREYFKSSGAKGAIVGNSGGKDSATVIGLLQMALGKDNVLTVTLPCSSNKQDREDAILVANTFNVDCINVDITDTCNSMIKSIEDGVQRELCSESIVNMKPRLRMTVLYSIAQTLNYLVVGTGNKCEIFVGYFTKHGDGASDYNPLAEFTVEEVYQIARYIGVPEKILSKAPSDGLGKLTDEEKMGVKYSQISEFIQTGTTDKEAMEKIIKLHEKTEHKRKMPRIYKRAL